MTDRQVRQLVPSPGDIDRETRQIFSDFSDQANIVLLGDPGAGKTHLFRTCAAATGGEFLTIRNFLNSPQTKAGATLFIDALDEKRIGRGDDDIIDKLVQKLFSDPPAKVRISCRERDWLSESDLAAFRPYFDQHGGFVVLRLEPLSLEDQRAVVLRTGVANPDSFLEEATARGLTEFLTNPKTSFCFRLQSAADNGQQLDQNCLRSQRAFSYRNPIRNGRGSPTGFIIPRSFAKPLVRSVQFA